MDSVVVRIFYAVDWVFHPAMPPHSFSHVVIVTKNNENLFGGVHRGILSSEPFNSILRSLVSFLFGEHLQLRVLLLFDQLEHFLHFVLTVAQVLVELTLLVAVAFPGLEAVAHNRYECVRSSLEKAH